MVMIRKEKIPNSDQTIALHWDDVDKISTIDNYLISRKVFGDSGGGLDLQLCVCDVVIINDVDPGSNFNHLTIKLTWLNLL